MKLETYSAANFDRGRSLWIELFWILLQWLFVKSWLPGSTLRILILRIFGANIGNNVTLKTGICIKYPWRLSIGNNSWIGENVWIDNLDEVTIGNNCCLSQAVYICTGNHNWNSSSFDLKHEPVKIDDNVWLCAYSKVAPGVKVGMGAVLTIGSVTTQDLEPWTVYTGNPAQAIKKRNINN